MINNAMKIENLCKSFGKGDNKVDVIDGANFSLNKGEFVALVAPSGAGKTTLLMMLGCVLEPSSGKITIGKEIVYDNKWLVKLSSHCFRDTTFVKMQTRANNDH